MRRCMYGEGFQKGWKELLLTRVPFLVLATGTSQVVLFLEMCTGALIGTPMASMVLLGLKMWPKPRFNSYFQISTKENSSLTRITGFSVNCSMQLRTDMENPGQKKKQQEHWVRLPGGWNLSNQCSQARSLY